MDYVNKILNKLKDPSSISINDIPQFWKSKYFYAGLAIGWGSLFYLRKLVQGYYRDYRAVVSLNDLSGKTALITGGNAGIGLGSAIHLAKLNANIIIACRNQKRASSAVEYIKQQTGNNNVTSMELDLSDLKSVELFASKINESDKIDIDYFILNAGIMNQDGVYSKDGLNLCFQTNYLSHWYLTNLLLDRIKSTASKRWDISANKYGAPVRIIWISSGGHTGADIPLDNDGWNGMIRENCSYTQSKLLQILHMRRLNQILHEYDQMIQCVSVTPGMVRTSIFSKYLSTKSVLMYPIYMMLYPLYRYVSRDLMTGCQVVLHVATNDKIVSGGYYSNCRLKATKGKNGCSNDENVYREVWNRTDSLIKSLQNNTFQ